VSECSTDLRAAVKVKDQGQISAISNQPKIRYVTKLHQNLTQLSRYEFLALKIRGQGKMSKLNLKLNNRQNLSHTGHHIALVKGSKCAEIRTIMLEVNSHCRER